MLNQLPQGRMPTEDAIRVLKADGRYSNLVCEIFADDDVVSAALRFARGEEFRAVASWAEELGIFPPAHIVDLGAGRGIASIAWALRGYEVTAVEPDPSCLVGSGAIRELVRCTGVPIRILEHGGEQIALTDSSIDLVYVRQTLHHAADLPDMCSEIARVLKPGGALIATREHVVSNRTQLEAFWREHPVHQLAGGEMAYELGEYLRALKSAGFKKLRVYGPWDSEVNYFPRSPEAVSDLAEAAAVRRFGGVVGRRLGRLPQFRRFWARYRSHGDDSPGRLYSFVARVGKGR
jgi:ubiquinone/menaquinone biosynthesis C-methylase UbiE